MVALKDFILLIFFFAFNNLIDAWLFFPAASVYQITASFSAPIEIPGRKLYLDWGFQMNYDLPVDSSQFTNTKIWPTPKGRKRRNDIVNIGNETAPPELRDKYVAYDGFNDERWHRNDFSAGELYESFENLLMRYGFHEICLLRSVCELARHPFADDQQNILTELLTFVLTPSLHQAFSSSESAYRRVYEDAETQGFLGSNCAELYCECEIDLLTAITKIIKF